MEILRLEKVTKEYLLKGETIRVLRRLTWFWRRGICSLMALGKRQKTLLHLMGGIDPHLGRIFLGDRENLRPVPGIIPGSFIPVGLCLPVL